MLCTNKCTAASYCRWRNNCRSIDIIIIIVVIIILIIIIMKLAISFSKLRLEADEIKLTLKNRFWQLCLLTNNYCGFWSNRTLLYFPLSSVRPSSVLRHRRDILTFFDILTVYTMKTIYFLNAYHPGW